MSPLAYQQSILRTFYQILPLTLGLLVFLIPRYREYLFDLLPSVRTSGATNKKRRDSKPCMLLLLLVVLIEIAVSLSYVM